MKQIITSELGNIFGSFFRKWNSPYICMQQMYIDMHFHDLDISLAYSKHNPRKKTFSYFPVYLQEREKRHFIYISLGNNKI